jgi:hypothetical protein
VDARIGETSARFEARLRQEIGRVDSSLMKWSFVFWIGSFAAVSAAIAALDQFLHH